MSRPSNHSGQSKFSNVPSVSVKRSRMDRSHGLKTSFGDSNTPSELVPIFVDEVLPGDSFHLKSTGFVRLATPLHPIMDNMYLDVHYFFVPYRLVWDNWQRFMGERNTPEMDPNDYSVPQVTIELPDAATDELYLYSFMGLPMRAQSGATDPDPSVSSLPFRAYRLIWNEWYRDQNLQAPADLDTDDGPDPVSYARLLYPRGKRKDYFTGALPWPQKGDPVIIPWEGQGSLAVYGRVSAGGADDPMATSQFSDGTYRTESFTDDQSPDNITIPMLASGSGATGNTLTSEFADTTWNNATNAATINDLRTAFQIQKLLERDARGGTRYIELIKSHFGVTSDDARLQRPEYLGGGTSRMSINPVANTAGGEAAGERPEGALGAFGTSLNQAKFSKSFTEHGVIIGLCSWRADLSYQRGIDRMWSRTSRYDFFWPALAHLGEQAILNKEIHFRGEPSDDEVFAYQERYGEYRYKTSRITGVFNSDHSASLDAWHLAQDFNVNASLPFAPTFIQEDPPIDRVIAVPSEDYFLGDFWFDLKCDRPMPIYAVPGFVDHF